MHLNDFRFESAQHTLAIANTPSFIIRKLKEDSEVQLLSRHFSGAALLQMLQNTLNVDAGDDLRARVLPFVLLVAVALSQDRVLPDTAQIVGDYQPEWFDDARSLLLATYRPSTFTKGRVQQARTTGKSSASSSPIIKGP